MTRSTDELLVETANNVRWIKEGMERDRHDQQRFNERTTRELNRVKSRLWVISGGLVTAQAFLAAVITLFKR